MSRALFWAQVKGARKLRDAATLLREAGRKDLVRNLQKAVKRAGDPALQKLKQSARTIKVTGYETPAKRKFTGTTTSKNLRQRIANATSIQVTTMQSGARVRFRTYGSKLGSAAVLPVYFDRGAKFRHPIMGHTTRWADQSGEPWFFEPIKDSLSGFRTEIDKAIDETVDMIESS